MKHLFRYATPEKIRNAIRVEWDYFREKHEVGGKPYKIVIDTCNVCNLRCPLCPTGTGRLKRERGLVDYNTYCRMLSPFIPYVFEVSLHNWGEPLLNPDIFRIIRHTGKQGIGTSLSTNLNVLNGPDAEKLVSSGLDYLVVSMDGTTRDVYDKYRVGGNLAGVLENLKKLSEIKKKLQRRRPVIELQFLVMKHNQHQICDARRMFAGSGADYLRFAPAGVPMEEFGNRALARRWMATHPLYRYYNPLGLLNGKSIIGGRCFYLFRSMTINPGGGISPCCVVHDGGTDFGDILTGKLEDIWNNPLYRSARALFSRVPGDTSLERTVCESCQLFRKR